MTEEEFNQCEIIADEAGFGAMETARGNLPLEALRIEGSIVGLTARIIMRQTYVNAFDGPLEAKYIFPLPARAAVVEFKMLVNDRVIDGVLKERGEARREYREAIEAGRRASIVEEDRPDTFNMRVGNIAPGEKATIEMSMVMPLVYAGGEATLRFPLVVAPRYIPGQPIGDSVGDGVAADTADVPDASRITPPTLLPGFPNPVDLEIEFIVDRRAFALTNLRSSLHALTLAESEGKTVVRVEPGERVNRDFILRFDLAEDEVSSGLTVVPDAEGNEGTFFATLLPGKRQAPDRPRDVVFVLDRSGSMGGWKMVAARRALGRMVDTLSHEDRFQVIAFDTTSERPPFGGGQLIEATNRNRYKAIEWLAKIDARGGTEMANPIFEGLGLLDGSRNRDRALVLVTDGQVGNEDQIIRGASKRLGSTRIFTVGIDQAVNAGFLNRLADTGRGQCKLVESEDRLDEVMDRIHEAIDTPLMTELRIALEGAELQLDTVVPERAATLFAGAPLTISGRFRDPRKVVATLRGADANGENTEISLEPTWIDDPRFAAVWAREQVRSLEDRYAAGETTQSLRDQIIDTSLEFGVLCRFTSFVAVDRSGDTVEGERHEVMQPVETPEGWQRTNRPAMMRAMSAPVSAEAQVSSGFAQGGVSPGSGGWDDLADGDFEASFPLESAAQRQASMPRLRDFLPKKRKEESSRSQPAPPEIDLEAEVRALGRLLQALLAGDDRLERDSVPEELRLFVEKVLGHPLRIANATEFARELAEVARASGIDYESLDFKQAPLGRALDDDSLTPMSDIVEIARSEGGFDPELAIALSISAGDAVAFLNNSGRQASPDAGASLAVNAEGQVLVDASAGSKPGLLERFARLMRGGSGASNRSDSFWK